MGHPVNLRAVMLAGPGPVGVTRRRWLLRGE